MGFSMQMKTIALAVAALVSGAAFAQSNVTLYGRLDMGYVYAKSDYRKFQGIEDGFLGASMLGVRGEEALGNGLKAVFNVEWRILGDEGTLASKAGSKVLGTDGKEYDSWSSDARWAYVGLAGKFGTVTAGRVRMISDEWSGAASSIGWTGITAANTLGTKLFNAGGDPLSNSRWNNAIKYVSPNFSGLDFMAAYSFGEKVNGTKNANGSYATKTCGSSTAIDSTSQELATTYDPCKGTDTSDAAKLGLGLRYANGPVSLIAIYEAKADDDSQKPFDAPKNKGYGAKGWRLGGAYDFNVVKVYASYSRTKANHSGVTYEDEVPGSDKRTLWTLGLSAPVSAAGNVWFEYAQYKDYAGGYDGAGYVNRGDKAVDGKPGHKAQAYSLGYNHNLSKRTSVHAFVSRFNNDRDIDNSYGKANLVGKNQNVFAMGIRHNF
jgi:predicted porin